METSENYFKDSETLTVQRRIDVKNSLGLRETILRGISLAPSYSVFNLRLYLLFYIQYLHSPIFAPYTWLQPVGIKPGGFDSPRQDQGAEDSDFNISRCVGAQNAH